MRLDAISVGPAPPWDVHVVIEIPLGGTPVKYELDKASGALFVDRFLHTSMAYPANYGFVPHTLAEDGDPIDMMVIAEVPVAVGAVVRARPIGVLRMKDEKGPDEKILGVPVTELHPYHAKIAAYGDLPRILTDQIEHFFSHYKDLEPDKWVEIEGWGGPEDAARLIDAAIERARAEEG